VRVKAVSRGSAAAGDGPPRPGRFPIILSGLVLPGAGQFVQKRWLPAVGYAVAFILAFILFGVFVFRILYAFYSLGFKFDTYEETAVPVRQALLSLAAAMGIYVVSLIDTFVAYRAACTRWSLRRRVGSIPALDEGDDG